MRTSSTTSTRAIRRTGDSRDDFITNRIVLVVILHEVAAKVADIVFDGIADGCLVFQQFMPVLRIALVLVVELVLIVRFIREKVRSQSAAV